MAFVHRTTIDGRYVLLRPLGSGGMAEVYLAHDEILDRDVALKVLRGPYANDEEAAERFRREAKSAGGLSHPNIVSVYDRGEDEDGTSYIAMEYVPGGTLKERIDERGPLEERRAAAVASQIASALEEAHERGVIHRDIKPQNVLVTASGDVKVTDFGIARAASAITISRTNAVFGTAAYLSPEQALGKPVDRRSDLYSLGIVLYEMLTGELPFDADNPMAVCMMHVHEQPFPPKELNPDVSDAMNALVLKLLAKDPDERPASATELLEDLDRARAGLPPGAPVPPKDPAGTEAAATETTPTRTQPTREAPPEETSEKTSEQAATTTRSLARPRRRRLPWVLAAVAVGVLALIGAALLALPGERSTPLDRAGDVVGGIVNPPDAAREGGNPGGEPSGDPGGNTVPDTPDETPEDTPPPSADTSSVPATPSSTPASTPASTPSSTPPEAPVAPVAPGGGPEDPPATVPPDPGDGGAGGNQYSP